MPGLHRHAETRGHVAREQRLAGAGLALDEQRPLEGDRAVHGVDEGPGGDVARGALELLEVVGGAHRNSPAGRGLSPIPARRGKPTVPPSTRWMVREGSSPPPAPAGDFRGRHGARPRVPAASPCSRRGRRTARPATTRVWVAEAEGALWLEAATAERPWYRDVLLDPLVSLDARRGAAAPTARCRSRASAVTRRIRGCCASDTAGATPSSGCSQDTSRSIAVRLEPLR